MVTHRVAALKDVTGVDFGEAIIVHTQNFSIAIVGGSRRESQFVFQIKNPASDAFGILANQRAFAGGNLYLVEIVPGWIAIV